MLGIRETANYDGFEGQYDFRVVDNPNELKRLIFEKNKVNNKSRLLAGYCWDWKKENRNKSDAHDIVVPEHNFSMSWNLGNTFTWAIDKDSMNEVGCIHTSQGLEFDYVGVILGPDIRYKDRKIVTDYNARAKTDQSLKGIRRLAKEHPEKAKKIADEIIKNTLLINPGPFGKFIDIN